MRSRFLREDTPMGKFQDKENGEEPGDATYCEGRSRAWGAKWAGEKHLGWPLRVRNQHGPDGTTYILHPPCWKCGADMGCIRCSGPTTNLLCNDCKDWGHPDALESHGRLLKTPEERAEAIGFLRSATEKVVSLEGRRAALLERVGRPAEGMSE